MGKNRKTRIVIKVVTQYNKQKNSVFTSLLFALMRGKSCTQITIETELPESKSLSF